MQLYFGRVEDINDPKKANRVRVRVFHIHTQDKAKIPNNKLFWSTVMMGTNHSNTSGIGTIHGLTVGSHVAGFFIDQYMQHFVVCFTYHGLEGDVPNQALKNYPFNKVTVSESGHLIEIDNTPENERININHRSGSKIEILANGDCLISYRDKDEMTSNSNVTINGNSNVTINGDSFVSVSGSETRSISGEYNVFANQINLNSSFGGGNANFIENRAFFRPNPLIIQPLTEPDVDEPTAPEQQDLPIIGTICTLDRQENPYNYSLRLLGLDWNESVDNKLIRQLWDELGILDPDYAIKNNISWCAVFVGAILKRTGWKYLRTASSRNYQNYGGEDAILNGNNIEEKISNAQAGDILIFSRNNSGNLGHIGFFTGEYNPDTNLIGCLGGNQRNSLNISYFTVNGNFLKLIDIKRPISCKQAIVKESIEPQECTLPTVINKFDNLQAMALNIYHEARGEAEEGQIAVAWVVKNRTFSNLWPNTYNEVIYQPKQFSWTEDTISNIPTDKTAYCKALEIARQVINNEIADPTNGSVYYHAKSINKPKLSIFKTKLTVDIGKHLFYNFEDLSKNPIILVT